MPEDAKVSTVKRSKYHIYGMNRLMQRLSDYRSTEGHKYHPNATLHTYDYAIRQVVRLIATHYSYHQASTGSHRGRKIKKEIKKDVMSDH